MRADDQGRRIGMRGIDYDIDISYGSTADAVV